MKAFSQDWVMMMIFINVLIIVAGMFLDSTTATLLLMPIVMPTCIAVGIDPVHLGIVVVFNLMIGMLTPPMGLSLYLISNMVGVPIPVLLKEVSLYFIPLIITLLIISFLPDLTLWLPNLLMN